MAEVQLVDIRKAFGAATVLDGVNLDIQHGEFVVFVGPSGCGKSTLLRVVAGLEDVSAGEVRIDGSRVNDASPLERGVAMVFQSYALYPQMSVYDNMAFALKLAKAPKAEIDAAVRAAAEKLSITPLLERKPAALSGGQRQRVAIGRAIVRKPKVFLFDEPLSNLDAALRVRMRYEFSKLHRDLGATMIYVTHDQVEAMTLADKLVVLSAGKVMQVGSPLELYERPNNRFVAGFIGSPRMNFIAGEVAGVSAAGADVRLKGGGVVRVEGPVRAEQGQAVTLGVRPEHFMFAQGDAAAVRGNVRFVERLGASNFAYLDAEGAEDEVVAQLPGDVSFGIGETIALDVAPSAAHLFDANGEAIARRAQA
jgi:multiple sugar transport system ATP-binding protein